MRLSGWGRYPRLDCRVHRPRSLGALRDLAGHGPLIARGNGRAYGDSALQAAGTVDMRGFDRMIAFDASTGTLEAEAGLLLGDVIAAFLPRGWFPMVTPGTKFVTLGGMAAADVHGKNHHRDGSFAAHVDWLDLLGADGTLRRCGPSENAALFAATLGGMGLTGVILRLALRLRPVETAWIRQETVVAPGLDAAIEAFEARLDATYSVAWIDCLAQGTALGRSLVMLGEHARCDDLPADRRARPFETPAPRRLSVPVDAPAALLSALTVRAFNAAYFRRGARGAGAPRLIDWDAFFYPLDAILGWNRIYGRRGFVQFQVALPLPASRAGLAALLAAIAASGEGPFLAVLKRFGPPLGPGTAEGLSFPIEGYTLALDFPVRPRSLALIDRLHRIALDHGGRFYLAKDACLTPEAFRAADPRAEGFAAMRLGAGLADAFASAQSRRLEL